VNDAPEPVRSHAAFEVPVALEVVLLECLEKDPAKRPSSAEALEAILEGVPLERRWTRADAKKWWDARGTASAR
jgi:serine/threonine-protein kinase